MADNVDVTLLQREHAKALDRIASLQDGGGGGTSDDMVPLKDYVDARDDAVESRLMAKLDTLATKDTIRTNVWGAVAAILAVLIGLAAFGGDRFDAGLSAADQRQEQLARDAAQNEAVAGINAKLDLLVTKATGEELKARTLEQPKGQ